MPWSWPSQGSLLPVLLLPSPVSSWEATPISGSFSVPPWLWQGLMGQEPYFLCFAWSASPGRAESLLEASGGRRAGSRGLTGLITFSPWLGRTVNALWGSPLKGRVDHQRLVSAHLVLSLKIRCWKCLWGGVWGWRNMLSALRLQEPRLPELSAKQQVSRACWVLFMAVLHYWGQGKAHSRNSGSSCWMKGLKRKVNPT